MTQFLHRFRAFLAALILAAILPVAALADYNNPARITYSYVWLDWHSGAITKYVQGPAGKRGEIEAILVVPTTAFVGTSTPANIQVGSPARWRSSPRCHGDRVGPGSPVNVPIVFDLRLRADASSPRRRRDLYGEGYCP